MFPRIIVPSSSGSSILRRVVTQEDRVYYVGVGSQEYSTKLRVFVSSAAMIRNPDISHY
jgi:hypothetical protein